MSDFKRQLDLAFDMRIQRRRQREAEEAERERAIRESHLKLLRQQQRFCTEVHDFLDKEVQEANRHLSSRPEKCVLHDVSGHFTGPILAGRSECNPIAYELRVHGKPIGETLVVELSQDESIEAFLCTCGPHVPNSRRFLRWQPVSLDKFELKIRQKPTVEVPKFGYSKFVGLTLGGSRSCGRMRWVSILAVLPLLVRY